MRPPPILRPRDEVFAARALAAMFLGSALLLVTYVLVQPEPLPDGGTGIAAGLLAGLVVCGVTLVTVPGAVLTRLCVWVVLPVVGLGVISTVAVSMPERLDLAHPLFGLVILYTASQLRAPVAAVVTALTIGCDVTVLALVEPPAEALVDAVFTGMVHAATAVLLVLVKNRVERLMSALERQAAVDGLTGLVTRRVLDDALSSALSPSSTPEGTALVLVDVDTFRSINDRHGHPVGDDALVHLPACCAATCAPRTPCWGASVATDSPCCCPVARLRPPPNEPSTWSPLSGPPRCSWPTARCWRCR